MGNAGGRIGACARSRRLLALLLCSTALSALGFAPGARAAGPAPLTTPKGGRVVAGSANIAQAPGQTTVTQGSARAAINWQSFNVGRSARVDFHQPSAHAVTLNRVLAADPSTIAGQIHANGSIVLVNPNGVVFANGSEVNAAGLVVSAAGISNKNFMAGRMKFDEPGRPDARITNKGRLTIRKAGLAALVAPQVANDGVIDAKLGHVVLAGAKTATLDLYGDGLVSLDVTDAVRKVPRGPDGKPVTALVTNSGTIVAHGGTVQLTAAVVDGIVTNLVDAGGKVDASGTAGKAAGTIVVKGVGGSISIPGTLLAEGGAGGKGGAIGLNATGAVTVAKSAKIDASGPAGGGVVAVGTMLARAREDPLACRRADTEPAITMLARAREDPHPQPLSQRERGDESAAPKAEDVTIAKGAAIAADATASGDGGRVTVLSAKTTVDEGAISARGGPSGGDGGFVEVSGHDLALAGPIDASALRGEAGSVLLDPYDLEIVNEGTAQPSGTPPNIGFESPPTSEGDLSTVSPESIEALNGNVTLQAIHDLTVESSVSLAAAADQSLTLQAGNNLTIDSGVVVSAPGDIELDAATPTIPGSNAAGALAMDGAITAGGNISLSAGTGGITFGGGEDLPNAGNVSTNATTGTLSISTSGFMEQELGIITAGTLEGSVSEWADLESPGNAIGTLGTFDVPQGLTLDSEGDLTVAGLVTSSGSFGGVTLDVAKGADTLGNITIRGSITVGGSFSPEFSPRVSLTSESGTINEGGTIGESGTGVITAPVLTGSSAGAASFSGDNAVESLEDFSAGGNFELVNTVPLTLAGPVSLSVDGGTITLKTDFLNEGSYFEPDSGVVLGGPLTDPSGALTVPKGEVLIEPYTPAVPVALVGSGSQPKGTLSLNDALLDVISANTLALTSFGSEPITISGSNVLGGLTNPNPDMNQPTSTGVDTLAVNAGGAFSEAAGASLDVGALTGSAGSVALNGTNAIETLGPFSSTGGFSLSDTPGEDASLTVAGSVSDPTGITLAVASGGLEMASGSTLASNGIVDLQVNENGAIDAANGVIDAGTLSFNAEEATLTNAENAIGTLGSYSEDGGEFDLKSQGNLTIAGPVTGFDAQGTIGVSGNITIAGTVNFPGDGSYLSLTSGGAITEQPDGAIAVHDFTGSSSGAAILDGNNAISNLDGFTAEGNFSLADSSDPAPVGTVSVPQGDTIALTVNGMNVQGVEGRLSAPGGEVSFAPYTKTSPVLLDAGVSGIESPPSTLLIDGDVLGIISAGTLGLGSFGAEPITVSGTNDLGSFDINALAINAGGAFSEAPGASLDVNALMGSAGSVALDGTNSIPILGPFTSQNGFSLTDATSLAVLGSVTAPGGISLLVSPGSLALGDAGTAGALSSSGTVNLQVPAGTITTPNGNVSAGTLTGVAKSLAEFGAGSKIAALGSFTVSDAGAELSLSDSVPLAITGPISAGTLFLADPGAIAERASGVLSVGALTGNAGSVALGSANLVSFLEEFASTGSFTLTDATSLAVLGSVTAPGGISLLVSPGSLTVGSASAFGLLSSAGTVALAVPQGSISVANGNVVAGTLAGEASGLAAFGSAKVGTLGAFRVSGAQGRLSLDDNAPLVITGPVGAAYLAIRATGRLALAGNLATLGLPLTEQSGADPALPGSVLIVLPNGAGSARFEQTGDVAVMPLAGSEATLRIQLPASNGTASFANLLAPNATLVLALGSGRASGTMAVGHLLVIGVGGSATLFGRVAGVGGKRAAPLARIAPAVNAGYLFNGCVIGTACATFVLPPVLPPAGSPGILVGGMLGQGLLEQVVGTVFSHASGTRVVPLLVFAPLTITEVENWSDSAGFPLPNVAREDY